MRLIPGFRIAKRRMICADQPSPDGMAPLCDISKRMIPSEWKSHHLRLVIQLQMHMGRFRQVASRLVNDRYWTRRQLLLFLWTPDG